MKEIKSIIFMMTEENIHGRTILSKLLEFKIPIKCIIVAIVAVKLIPILKKQSLI